MAADQGPGFQQYRRPTKRDLFLETMDQVVPWTRLCEVVEPHYPKGVGGRPPVGLERMPRMYFVQHWFNLADVACEEAFLDSTALRRFEMEDATAASALAGFSAKTCVIREKSHPGSDRNQQPVEGFDTSDLNTARRRLDGLSRRPVE